MFDLCRTLVLFSIRIFYITVSPARIHFSKQFYLIFNIMISQNNIFYLKVIEAIIKPIVFSFVATLLQPITYPMRWQLKPQEHKAVITNTLTFAKIVM